jgi:anti-anti-sigma factor
MPSNEFSRLLVSSRRLDAKAVNALSASVSAEWSAGARVITLDLSAVEEIDSMGIAGLVAMNKRRPAGSRVVLSALCDYVRDIIEVTQLHLVFDIFDSAIAAELALSA